MDNNSPFFTQSRNFNTNTSHPLIPSSQEYMYFKKYVSIHSEDRNMLKYANYLKQRESYLFRIPSSTYNIYL